MLITDPVREIRMKFAIGQLIHHRIFDYRGVIVGADLVFRLPDEWYEQVARTRPPRDQPWYNVLVDGAPQVTYVAERNLELDRTGEPVEHPFLSQHFDRFEDGCYSDSRSSN